MLDNISCCLLILSFIDLLVQLRKGLICIDAIQDMDGIGIIIIT